MLGTPLRPQNLLNACRRMVADNSLVSSRCSALVDAHKNKHVLVSLLSVGLTEVSLTYNGPTQSTVLLKGGSVLTRSNGKGGIGGHGVKYSFPSCLRHAMHLHSFSTSDNPITFPDG